MPTPTSCRRPSVRAEHREPLQARGEAAHRVGRSQGQQGSESHPGRVSRRARAHRVQRRAAFRRSAGDPETQGAAGADPQLELDVLHLQRGAARLRVRAGPGSRQEPRRAARDHRAAESRGAVPVSRRGAGRSHRGGIDEDCRSERSKYAFSAPYQFVNELLVVPADDTATRSLADLKGKKIAVRKSSSYYQTLVDFQRELGFEIERLARGPRDRGRPRAGGRAQDRQRRSPTRASCRSSSPTTKRSAPWAPSATEGSRLGRCAKTSPSSKPRPTRI